MTSHKAPGSAQQKWGEGKSLAQDQDQDQASTHSNRKKNRSQKNCSRRRREYCGAPLFCKEMLLHSFPLLRQCLIPPPCPPTPPTPLLPSFPFWNPVQDEVRCTDEVPLPTPLVPLVFEASHTPAKINIVGLEPTTSLGLNGPRMANTAEWPTGCLWGCGPVPEAMPAPHHARPRRRTRPHLRSAGGPGGDRLLLLLSPPPRVPLRLEGVHRLLQLRLPRLQPGGGGRRPVRQPLGAPWELGPGRTPMAYFSGNSKKKPRRLVT